MNDPASPDASALAAPSWGGVWALYLDQRITRRKFYAFVVNPEGKIAFRGRRASQAFDWIDAEGIRSYKVITETLEIELRALGSQPVERDLT